MKSFIKQKLHENLDYALLENLIDEEYPSNFNMEVFKSLTSFQTRIKYCEENLQRISQGSARIVYMIDNEKVLKLAKNQKGVAQNEVEIQWGNDWYFKEILAATLDNEDNSLWVEMELARKVTVNIFKQVLGFEIKNLFYYLKNWEQEMKGRPRIFGLDPAITEQLSQNDFVNSLCEFADAQGAGIGDFGKLSSYGLVKRDGQDSIVLIDFGLTNDVYTSYYR